MHRQLTATLYLPAVSRDLGDLEGQAQALNETGGLNMAQKLLDQSVTSHQAAIDLARRIGSPWNEAHALAGLGRCALSVGRTAEAVEKLREALRIFQRIGAAEKAEIAIEVALIADAQ
jgi:tetratricopeptide (TPR) repeat protein